MNNLMFTRNVPGYRELQEVEVESQAITNQEAKLGSQAVLFNTERIAVLIAQNLNELTQLSIAKTNIRKLLFEYQGVS